MKMRITSNPYAVAPLLKEGIESGVALRNLQRQQLATRLKRLANEEYQLMVKIKVLANTLKKPAFTDIIESADYFSDKLMASLNHYVYHIKHLENSAINLPSIVTQCEPISYVGWVDRVKEQIAIHLRVKQQIVDIFVNFPESEFKEVFHFLKEQLTLHEDELWHLRNQIDA